MSIARCLFVVWLWFVNCLIFGGLMLDCYLSVDSLLCACCFRDACLLRVCRVAWCFCVV